MAEDKKYPYTTVPGQLRKLLEKIPTIGAPDKATLKWLAGIGFAGRNNQSLLPVLRHLGVIDKSGVPTEYWTALRSGNKATFAEAVRKGYPELFTTYPDADKRDSATLQTFFRTHTGLGEKAQGLLARTFKVLVEFGDFSKPSAPVVKPADRSESAADAGDGSDDGGGDGNGGGGGVSASRAQQPFALTVNLQIELPPSADGAVYDKLFAAMGKHLKGLITPPK